MEIGVTLVGPQSEVFLPGPRGLVLFDLSEEVIGEVEDVIVDRVRLPFPRLVSSENVIDRLLLRLPIKSVLTREEILLSTQNPLFSKVGGGRSLDGRKDFSPHCDGCDLFRLLTLVVVPF